MKKSIFKKIFGIGAALLCAFGTFGVGFAHAAVITITPSATAATVGTPVQFDIAIDPQGSDVNAIQGSVDFPQSLFAVPMIDDGASLINFWIVPPAVSSSGGEVDFAGIIPGGFNGSSGPLFSLILTPLAVGTGSIDVASATVLANDGLGSNLPVTGSVASVAVVSSSNAEPVPPSHSLISPEPFAPQIEQDPNLFGGEYFLVFATTDKGTGIDHYEVLEVPTGWSFGPSPAWHVAESPYVLTDQSLSSNIYVRAVDHAGNFIVVEVPARYPRSGSNVLVVDAIIVAVIFLIVVILWCIWFLKRKRRS